MTDDIVKYLRLSRTRFNRHAEAADEIERLRAENKRWSAVTERLYDIMLAHESVSDDEWNQGLEDCYQLMMGDIRAANNSNP